jgi:hypothetical protein
MVQNNSLSQLFLMIYRLSKLAVIDIISPLLVSAQWKIPVERFQYKGPEFSSFNFSFKCVVVEQWMIKCLSGLYFLPVQKTHLDVCKFHDEIYQ